MMVYRVLKITKKLKLQSQVPYCLLSLTTIFFKLNFEFKKIKLSLIFYMANCICLIYGSSHDINHKSQMLR